MQILPASIIRESRCCKSLLAAALFFFFSTLSMSQNVGVNTESPKAGLQVLSNNGLLADGTFGNGIVPDSGVGTRLMWVPKLAAIRFGTVNTDYGGIYEQVWHPAYLGQYSFASGLNTKASGFGSFSHGDRSEATGTYSIAMGGAANVASGLNAVAIGHGVSAPSFGEVALGTFNLLYSAVNPTGHFATDRLFTIGSGSGVNDRRNVMTILKNGKVGIGTESPSYHLDVVGSVQIQSGRLHFSNTRNSIWIGDGAGSSEVDGGYPNVLIGHQAGTNIMTGEGNVALGYQNLYEGATADFNVAIGQQALRFTSSGESNIGIGRESLYSNTSGHFNIAMGATALRNATVASHNIAIGEQASLSNLTGNNNIALGQASLYGNVNGSANVAIGIGTGASTMSGQNVYIGYEAGRFNTGEGNVFLGHQTGKNSLASHTLLIDNSDTSTPLIHGDFTTNKVTINDSLETLYFTMTHDAADGKILTSDASGHGTWSNVSDLTGWTFDSPHLYNSNSGNVGIGTDNPVQKLHIAGSLQIQEGRIDMNNQSRGTFIGYEAGLQDVALNQNANTFIGYRTGKQSTTGGENTAMGINALRDNTTGIQNTVIGGGALQASSSASFNSAIGYNAMGSGAGYTNVAIGYYSLFESNGMSNVAVGEEAGKNNITGNTNIFLGRQSGLNSTGSSNILIGNEAGKDETGSNKLIISSHPTNWLLYGDLSTGDLAVQNHLESESFEALEGQFKHLTIDTGSISFTNTGESIFIGDGAGINDDRSDNRNVFIGQDAGSQNISGNSNIAIGALTLDETNASFNIGIGQEVMSGASQTGQLNIGIGNFSMIALTDGHDNVAIGQNTLGGTTTGYNNIALGHYALDQNTAGGNNVAIGFEALGSADTNDNTAVGSMALRFTTGAQNTAIGRFAGLAASGSGNVLIGYSAGSNAVGDNQLFIANSNTSSPLLYGNFSTKKLSINDSLSTKYFQISQGILDDGILQSDAQGRGTWAHKSTLFQDDNLNIFIGEETGQNITTGNANTVVGAFAGAGLTTGYENTVLGETALSQSLAGDFNTAIGRNALGFANTGDNNTAVGWGTLAGTTGAHNTGLGAEAGGNNPSGSRNVYVGTEAGRENQGSDNVFIGYRAGKNEAGSNKLYIDNTDTSTPLIQGDFSTNTVSVNNTLGVSTSDPKSTIDVNGSVGATFKTPLVAGTNDPDATGMVWRYTSGTGTITLPGAGTCPNRIYVIINQTGTTRNISTFRNLTTSNQSTIGSSVALWVMSDGSEWWQIK